MPGRRDHADIVLAKVLDEGAHVVSKNQRACAGSENERVCTDLYHLVQWLIHANVEERARVAGKRARGSCAGAVHGAVEG